MASSRMFMHTSKDSTSAKAVGSCKNQIAKFLTNPLIRERSWAYFDSASDFCSLSLAERFLVSDGPIQPRPGDAPFPLDGGGRNSHNFRRFLDTQAAEE